MMFRFLVLFLFISCVQAISASDFHTRFTSESRSFNHSSGQTQQFLERSYKSTEDKMSLDEKVQRKNELSDTSRKAQRGRGGVYGGANINHRPRHFRSSAASLSEVPRFWVSTLILSVISLALIFVFPFH